MTQTPANVRSKVKPDLFDFDLQKRLLNFLSEKPQASREDFGEFFLIQYFDFVAQSRKKIGKLSDDDMLQALFDSGAARACYDFAIALLGEEKAKHYLSEFLKLVEAAEPKVSVHG